MDDADAPRDLPTPPAPKRRQRAAPAERVGDVAPAPPQASDAHATPSHRKGKSDGLDAPSPATASAPPRPVSTRDVNTVEPMTA